MSHDYLPLLYTKRYAIHAVPFLAFLPTQLYGVSSCYAILYREAKSPHSLLNRFILCWKDKPQFNQFSSERNKLFLVSFYFKQYNQK